MAKPDKRKPPMVLGDPSAAAPPPRGSNTSPPEPERGQDTAPKTEPRKPISVQIPASIADRARALVHVARGSGELPDAESLTTLVASALDEKIRQFEDEFNGGEPFEMPRMRLAPGRVSRSG